MAEKKRFRIGNTTINLGVEGLGEVVCRYPTNACANYTYIDCLYTNHTLCGYKIPTVVQECAYHTLRFTTDITIGCGYTGGGCGFNYSKVPTDQFTPTLPQPIRETSPVELQDIKESLLTQLKAIEEQEEEMKKKEVPQTREELDLLESELENTLKELKELKKGMK